jgi:AcrR family transcriptional regulator
MPESTRPPQRKRRNAYHHGNLRQALVEQAVQTIQRHGVEALTLRAVAASLRVSRTALYRHFADKRALLAAVATQGFRTFRMALLAGWDAGGGGQPGFDAMGLAYVRFALANSSYYRVMFGGFVDHSDRDSELVQEAAAAFQVLVDAIVEQQRAGLIRPDAPELLARYIWATVHGVAMLAIDGQLPPEQPAEELAALAMAGLRTGIAP